MASKAATIAMGRYGTRLAGRVGCKMTPSTTPAISPRIANMVLLLILPRVANGHAWVSGETELAVGFSDRHLQPVVLHQEVPPCGCWRLVETRLQRIRISDDLHAIR